MLEIKYLLNKIYEKKNTAKSIDILINLPRSILCNKSPLNSKSFAISKYSIVSLKILLVPIKNWKINNRDIEKIEKYKRLFLFFLSKTKNIGAIINPIGEHQVITIGKKDLSKILYLRLIINESIVITNKFVAEK